MKAKLYYVRIYLKNGNVDIYHFRAFGSMSMAVVLKIMRSNGVYYSGGCKSVSYHEVEESPTIIGIASKDYEKGDTLNLDDLFLDMNDIFHKNDKFEDM